MSGTVFGGRKDGLFTGSKASGGFECGVGLIEVRSSGSAGVQRGRAVAFGSTGATHVHSARATQDGETSGLQTRYFQSGANEDSALLLSTLACSERKAISAPTESEGT